jgi:putative transposase
VTRYRCVDAQKAAGFPVAAACQAAGVTRSRYYAWAAGSVDGSSERHQQEVKLLVEVRAIHSDSHGTYGTPRVHAELRRRGWRVNHKRVERLMRAHGIVGHRPRRRRSLTKPDSTAAPVPDLLGRLFDPDQPDVAWCGDVTYIPTDEGWLYLASVIDLESRHLLGYSMGNHQRRWPGRGRPGRRRGHPRPLPDGRHDLPHRPRQRGHLRRLRRRVRAAGAAAFDEPHGIVPGQRRRRELVRILKVELVDRRHWRTRAEARAAVFAWIHYYNRSRLHSTRGYLPPVQWEQQHATISPLLSATAA